MMPAAPWPAPPAGGPVRAEIRVPGSKSMTARALLLASVAMGSSTLLYPSETRDSVVLARGLRGMGCHVSSVDERRWLLRPRPLTGAEVDVERSGTAMRFLPAVAGLAAGTVRFDGDPALRPVPLGPLVGALRALGVRAEAAGGLPLAVHGVGRVRGGEVTLDASASSQLVSGLLLAGTDYDRGLVLRHVGGPLAAHPHIDLTVAMLRAVGAAVDAGTPDVWEVEAGRLVGRAWEIEPDLAAAAPFLAAALVTGGRVTVPNWPPRTVQPGETLRALLTDLGGRCHLGTDGLTVAGTGTPSGVDADVTELTELLPVLAALCALADSPSTLRGVTPVRGLVAAFAALGADLRPDGDTLLVTPRPLHGGPVDTRGDHRLAYAAAVLGLAVPGVVLSDVTCTAKTLPDFVARWARMLKNNF
jgi:3-phosphoshikimate 1-carboxyvinyltransferase